MKILKISSKTKAIKRDPTTEKFFLMSGCEIRPIIGHNCDVCSLWDVCEIYSMR